MSTEEKVVELKSSNHEEQAYLELVKSIIETGDVCRDRTGVGTHFIFGAMQKYSLKNDAIPLLTTKRVFWKGVVEELLWFIKADMNANLLDEKGVKIWNSNADDFYTKKLKLLRELLTIRETELKAGEQLEELDKIEINVRVEEKMKDEKFVEEQIGKRGDLGRVYGAQWRKFGSTYPIATDDAPCADFLPLGTSLSLTSGAEDGFDQLADVIEKIKENVKTGVTCRRILMVAWNPKDLPYMALPPCHVLWQFRVIGDELSCILYQRSVDTCLGLPFNIASASLLTRMIAHLCGLRAREFTHMMGDTHVYLNHVDAVKEQLKRTPTKFPQMKILRSPEEIGSIDSFKFEDFQLIDYKPQAAIKMDMAV